MKNNSRANKLDKSFREMIIPISIICVFILFISIGYVKKISGILNPNNYILDENAIWEQTFKDAESNKVGIIFDVITNTEEDYVVLRNACDNYIKENDIDELDGQVEVKVSLDENQFVDDNYNNNSNNNNGEMVETGPIFFQNILMLRYINVDGKLKVVAGISTDSGITVVRQSEIGNFVETSYYEDDTNKTQYITEKKYLSDVADTIIKLLLAKTKDQRKNAESMAIKYFTLDGKTMILSCREEILKDSKNIQLKCIMAGKSEANKQYKDRIYLQLIRDNNETSNIIIKLNRNLRIYDIDLV